MLVSILIPVYNRESFIEQTINSAINQSYKNIEIVVVDNASTDDTWTIVKSMSKKDKRIKAFRNEVNVGPLRNWRRCLDESNGEYTKILWSDDLIDARFIEECLELMNDDTAFVYSAVKVFKDYPDAGDVFYDRGRTEYFPSDEFISSALFSNEVPVSPGCALFRRKDVNSYLLTDIENSIGSDFSMHAIGNDLLLFLLTAKDYKQCGSVDKPLAFFRHHRDSISVSSSSVRLSLHYNIAKAYFCERYYRNYMKEYIAFVWLYLKIHPETKLYNVYSLNDMFVENVQLEIKYLLGVVFSRFWRALKRILL